MPRKKLEWTSVQIEAFKKLCSIFCSKDEIARVMGCSEDELDKLINKHLREDVVGKKSQRITFDEAFAKYSADGKMSLRRKQYELAMKGDRSMLIWLGKQYLHQSDPDRQNDQKKKQAQSPASVDKLKVFRTNSPVSKAAGM